jgi:hypothetical protein
MVMIRKSGKAQKVAERVLKGKGIKVRDPKKQESIRYILRGGTLPR